MAGKIQRKHPQAQAVNQTLLTSLENFIETAKNSNHKLTSLLLIDKEKTRHGPLGHLTYTREHITQITSKSSKVKTTSNSQMDLLSNFSKSMKKVSEMKHIGVIIKSNGYVTVQVQTDLY